MTMHQTRESDTQIQVLDIPNEIKVGYSPIGFVRCGRAACRISKLKWKMGKETGGKKMEVRFVLRVIVCSLFLNALAVICTRL